MEYGCLVSVLQRNGKGTTIEGGVRVPAVFSWPGSIAPGVWTRIIHSDTLALSGLADLEKGDFRMSAKPDSKPMFKVSGAAMAIAAAGFLSAGLTVAQAAHHEVELAHCYGANVC